MGTIPNIGGLSVYTSAEQAARPTCGVCGRTLGVGYYYTCHICSQSYCYAHAPTKCNHPKQKQPTTKVPLVR